ncbi:uncharacterized protein BDZ99DRAFT_458516 [Mytilinidion resinicola]|uniref:Uncharacterized protein n=1 Tax=Mytilinidion resinicola TaxID=574789 RepID=A0A6A6Z8Q0_9PEZI|nr:uncharacterized protein BDZ99DRAFT_458516 [Mytilinidion resinicola]KAF2816674.1 hypothetical protein BDZ99DRAFT_458516 [Mytilinidion resinicola]
MFLFILILAITAYFVSLSISANNTVSEAESKPAVAPTPKPRLKPTRKPLSSPPPPKPYAATPPTIQELAELEDPQFMKTHPFTHPELYDIDGQIPGDRNHRPFITSRNKIRCWNGYQWIDEDFGFNTEGYGETADGYFGQWVPYLEGNETSGWRGGVRFQFRARPGPRPPAPAIVKRALIPAHRSPEPAINEPDLEPSSKRAPDTFPIVPQLDTSAGPGATSYPPPQPQPTIQQVQLPAPIQIALPLGPPPAAISVDLGELPDAIWFEASYVPSSIGLLPDHMVRAYILGERCRRLAAEAAQHVADQLEIEAKKKKNEEKKRREMAMAKARKERKAVNRAGVGSIFGASTSTSGPSTHAPRATASDVVPPRPATPPPPRPATPPPARLSEEEQMREMAALAEEPLPDDDDDSFYED